MIFPFPFVVIRIIMKVIILRDSSLLGFDFKKWQRFCVSREFILSRFVKFRWLDISVCERLLICKAIKDKKMDKKTIYTNENKNSIFD